MSKTSVITLKPLAGFCIKSSTIQPALFRPPTAPSHILEPPPGYVPIPVGFKIFVNVAWDQNVPPPPDADEQAVRNAVDGKDANSEGWYVPVVVSDGRQDKDKAGKPCLVFDCIYNTSVKARTLTDPEFKLFITELALQRIEAQASMVLSRQIASPNIVSKGKLLPRTISIPSFLTTGPLGPKETARSPALPQPLIQEVTPVIPSSNKPKGILKSASSPANRQQALNTATTKQQSRPTWSWSKEDSRLQIKISVPHLPITVIEQATLDVEARRFIVQIPGFPILDVDLNLSDAEIVATAASKTSASLHGVDMSEPNNALTLKRQGDLDLNDAYAEWRVAEDLLVVYA